jgi:hypothetical protein
MASHEVYKLTVFESLAASALMCTLVAFLGGHVLGVGLRSLGDADIKQTAARSVTPKQALQRDRSNTLKIAPIAYVISAAAMITAFYPALQWHRTLMELAAATASIITYSLVFPAWVRYRVAHLVLASRGLIPVYFTKFLEDAHYLGVLRQTGLSYQFRHELLRKSLADPSWGKVQVRQ